VTRKLSLTRDAGKFLDCLDAKQFRQVVRRVLALAEDAAPPDSTQMAGSRYHRVDQGEYRIVYRFDEETVYIVLIGKRNDNEVYDRLRRRP
jgi:mRNA interferase RelE/StbE